MGNDKNLILKIELEEKPKVGFSHAKEEAMIMRTLAKVRSDSLPFLDDYFNCEITKEGIANVTLKSNVNFKGSEMVEDLIDMRYKAISAIEQAFGIGFGENIPQEIDIPNFVAAWLDLDQEPIAEDDFKDKKKRRAWENKTVKVALDAYKAGLRYNGLIPIKFIQDLDKQKKEDD